MAAQTRHRHTQLATYLVLHGIELILGDAEVNAALTTYFHRIVHRHIFPRLLTMHGSGSSGSSLGDCL